MSFIKIINESFDKQNKKILVESKLTQLRKAFGGELDDYYDTEELLGSIFPQFARKAYKIVKNHGYSGVFSEIDTQGDLGDDFFYANKDGKAYMGSYNYQQELDDITEIVLFGKATTYKELIDELAEWYANLILSKLEFDSDEEWDESEWAISEGYTKSSKANDDDLDENIFIKKQKRKSQKLKEAAKKVYKYIVVNHFSPEDFYLIKSNHPVDENMFDAWNFLDVTDKHGKGTVIWNDEYIDFNESGNKSIADLDNEYREGVVRYLSDLEKNGNLDTIKDEYISFDELEYEGYLTDFPAWLDPGDGDGVIEEYMNDKTLKNSYLATAYSDYLENSYVDKDSSSAAAYVDIDDLTQYTDYEEFFDEDDEDED